MRPGARSWPLRAASSENSGTNQPGAPAALLGPQRQTFKGSKPRNVRKELFSPVGYAGGGEGRDVWSQGLGLSPEDTDPPQSL